MKMQGYDVTAKVTQFGGNRGYLFWIEDSYWPTVYFVRGDSFTEAYENFLCDERIEKQLATPWNELEDEEREEILNGSMPSGYDYNDNGVLLYTETIGGKSLSFYDND